MTATIDYDKSIFEVSSVVKDEGRYKFTVQEDSAAESGDEPDADDDADEEDKPMMKKEGSSAGSGEK